MLAYPYNGQKINGWLMSEKLDGVRAIWTGAEFVSRNGNKFFAPEWFTAQLPAGVTLDGELFIGRGKFQATVGLVKKKTPVAADWKAIRFCVFDAPLARGGFEARLAYCATTLEGCKVAAVVPHRVCRNEADLAGFFTMICNDGAEGVMLRKPESEYEHRRSQSLLKYKPFDNAEAVMIGSEEGEGKFTGKVGALVLRWRGIVFRVGSGLSDQIRDNPPIVGSLISFGFCGLTDGGVPRFPTFIADRNYE